MQLKVTYTVIDQHRTFFFFRHLGEVLFHNLDRVRPFARGVGEIGAPHQFIGADAVTSLDTYRIMQKTPVVVFLDVFARFTLQTIETPVVMNNVDIAVVVVIDLPQAVFEPADHGLRPIKLEIWETVPDTGKRQLQRRSQARVGKASEKSKRILLMDVRPGLFRVKKVRLSPA